VTAAWTAQTLAALPLQHALGGMPPVFTPADEEVMEPLQPRCALDSHPMSAAEPEHAACILAES